MDSRVKLWFRNFWIIPIRFYKKFISPHLPKACLYHPSCSEYAAESIIRFGVLAGIILGVLRLLRCNGLFFTGGEDPVPERIDVKHIFILYGEFWKYKIKSRKRKK